MDKAKYIVCSALNNIRNLEEQVNKALDDRYILHGAMSVTYDSAEDALWFCQPMILVEERSPCNTGFKYSRFPP